MTASFNSDRFNSGRAPSRSALWGSALPRFTLGVRGGVKQPQSDNGAGN